MNHREDTVATFLSSPERWPRDLSGKRVFLIKAVQDIGRYFKHRAFRLPACLSRYELDLPAFADASAQDRENAALVLNYNTVGTPIIGEDKMSTASFESPLTKRDFRLDEIRWAEARRIIQVSRHQRDENIQNAIAIASVIFEGVARNEVKAYLRTSRPVNFENLMPDDLNIDREEAVKARLARGLLDTPNVFSTDPIGHADIFLDTEMLEKWKSRRDGNPFKAEIAKNFLVRKVHNQGNVLKAGESKESLCSENIYGLALSSQDKDELWRRLPDVPFKLAGVRRSK